jgi:hypothetical protein
MDILSFCPRYTDRRTCFVKRFCKTDSTSLTQPQPELPQPQSEPYQTHPKQHRLTKL